MRNLFTTKSNSNMQYCMSWFFAVLDLVVVVVAVMVMLL